MIEILRREYIYVSFYFSVQLNQILPYWIIGMVIGSAVSVFGKKKIHAMLGKIQGKKLGLWGIVLASMLGIASPLCMYGTIPIAASFWEKGLREDYLAAFMMSSVLLNPQLLIYSAALGNTAMLIRLISCTLCGIAAGLLLYLFYVRKGKGFFTFKSFGEPTNRDTDPNLILRFIKNLWRNVKATGLYFLLGVLLSALFQRYVPAQVFASLFGEHRGFGILLAATIGVPIYVCGGGTIPLLAEWMSAGMSLGSATAFMITGPATKITNLGALKIVLGLKRFIAYLVFVMAFSLLSGLLIELIISI